MPSSSLSVVVQHLCAAERDGGGSTYGELLTRFLGSRDEAALATLVVRHAPMVWGVCRRLLRNPHDAEDAFQATFLVLVRKAASVKPREMVGNWLYGVAQQTAVRLGATATKRGEREVQMKELPEPAVGEAREDVLLSELDQELSRLPNHYRGVVVLCDLEGMTRKEAARQLGIPEGSVASRLARARAMLAKRLTQRGIVFSGGALAAGLTAMVASAGVPSSVVSSTIKAASLLTAGKTAGAISAEVIGLTEGVINAMMITRLKTAVAALFLLLGIAALGGGLFMLQTAAAQNRGEKPANPPPVPSQVTAAPIPQEKPKEKQKADGELILGTWQVDKYDLGPGAPPLPIDIRGMKATFKAGGKLTQSSIGGMPPMEAAEYKLDPAAKVKEIDITVDGRTTPGIYELTGDTLKICLDEGKNANRPAAMIPDGSGRVAVISFKRVKEEKEK